MSRSRDSNLTSGITHEKSMVVDDEIAYREVPLTGATKNLTETGLRRPTSTRQGG